MEHMRMDPKHQFAAQYMLSRAAAERRERDTILAAAVAGGSGLLAISQNSRGASPAQSDTSSCNGRLSSAPSEHGQNQHPNDSNNNQNNGQANGPSLNDSNNNDNNNNTNGPTGNMSGMPNFNGKLSINDVLRSQSNAVAGHLQQFSNSCLTNGIGGSPGNPATSAAQAVVNLAAAMRMNPQQNSNQHLSQNGNQQSPSSGFHQNANQQLSHHHQQHQQHHHLQNSSQSPEAALRMHQAEAILRSQAEAALRLAVSQAAAVVASNGSDAPQNNQFRHHNGTPYGSNTNHHQNSNSQLQNQFSPDLSEALRLQEQRLEQALRLHQQGELGLHQQHHSQP